MKQVLTAHKTLLIIISLTVIGTFLRFYNLNWGAPFYFHPDERNIASSIMSLHFPDQMNPHFFAYGSFPLYVIYFTGILINIFSQFLTFTLSTSFLSVNEVEGLNFQLSFEQAIIISRFYSASFSVLLIPSLYYIGNKILGKEIGILAAFFTTFNPGFIQFAHFGTFEMWIAFLSVWLFYYCVVLTKRITVFSITTTSILTGLLISVKISNIVLIVLPILALIFSKIHTPSYSFKHFLHTNTINIFIFIFVTGITLFLTSPYFLLDYPSFHSSINYESSVAVGTLPVFYTGGFFNTIPIVYQLVFIFPFLVNPFLTIIGIIAVIYLLYITFKHKKISVIFLLLFFFILFFSQAFLFVKWTRYMTPTLPFLFLLVVYFLTFTHEQYKTKYIVLQKIVFLILIFSSIIWSISYFKTAFMQNDTRIEASLWAKENIPSTAKILSEVYDLGTTPFNQYFPHITLFNFYDLDPYSQISNFDIVESYDYIILPSQRILRNRLQNPKKFPNGSLFYTQLLNGSLGFTKVYETSCDIFCKITYLGNPVFHVEETANVFDRPTLMIFQRN